MLAPKRKHLYKSAEEIKPILTDWEDDKGCFASDRITVDGCKVGLCYRKAPDPESDLPDSGWRFLAGDETDEYINNPKNAGVYDLNTICNYDTDIIPLLHAPYGTAFERNKKGIFEEIEDFFEDLEDEE